MQISDVRRKNSKLDKSVEVIQFSEEQKIK